MRVQNFCLSNGLKNRGVNDIFNCLFDGLSYLLMRLKLSFETEIQQCIIHQIRNTTKYVSYKDIKALMADLKRVYVQLLMKIQRYKVKDRFDEIWGRGKIPETAG